MKGRGWWLGLGLVVVVLVCLFALGAEGKKGQPKPKSWHLEVPQGNEAEVQEVSLTDAFNYLMYCWASYCSSNIPDWNCHYCSENQVVASFKPYMLINGDGGNLFSYVGSNPTTQEVIAIFRGTIPTDLENWLADLNTIKTSWAGSSTIEVHEGFYESYLNMAADLNNAVFTLMEQNPSYQLVVTGHSLGGAMATLAALNLTVNYGKSPIVYTFGSPRVGNDYFEEYFTQNVPVNYRLVNYDDIVPHVPPQDFGFEHVVQEIWYNGSDWIACSTTDGEDPNCADSVSVIH